MKKTAKRMLLGLALLFLAALEIYTYLNMHFYYKAKNTIKNDKQRMIILEKASRMLPFNDAVFFSLGKLYLNFSRDGLIPLEEKTKLLRKSKDSFKRSLQLNPGNYQSHFYLAQVIQYLNYFTADNKDFINEFKKASFLTTFDEEAYFEIGRILLSRWQNLNKEERDFTLSILKNAISASSKERIQVILPVWFWNVKEEGVLEELLPRTPEVNRLYADFLGERGLFLETRWEKLAQAEAMDFEQARKKYSQGKIDFRLIKLSSASDRFKEALNNLKRIHFYQKLTAETSIDENEYLRLKKELNLWMSRLLIERLKPLQETKDYLFNYIDLEEEISNLIDLEKYLESRNILKRTGGFESEDLLTLYLDVLLDFKMSRYQTVIDKVKGRQGFILTKVLQYPFESGQIWRMLGDSYQRFDFLYDAEKYYLMTLEIIPEDISTLLSLEKTYERLNDQEMLKILHQRMDKIFSPEDISYENIVLEKGKGREFVHISRGGEKKFDLVIDSIKSQEPALISIFINNKIIWENFFDEEMISFQANTVPGKNSLKIVPLNQNVIIRRIKSKNIE